MKNTTLKFFQAELAHDEKLTILAIAIVIILFIFFFVLLIITICSNPNKNKKARESTRIYILYLNENKVRYFDKNKMNVLKEFGLQDFYQQFDKESIENVKQWVSNLFSNKKNQKLFIEAHIKINRYNSKEFVLLEATHINLEEKIIHIESNLLPRLTSTSNKHSGRRFIISYESFSIRFSALQSLVKKHGICCLFIIYPINSSVSSCANSTLNALTLRCVNKITPYLSKNRSLTFTGVNEFVILDSLSSTRSQYLQIVNALVRRINMFLATFSLNEEYGVAVGAKFIGNEDVDIKSYISKCRELSIYAERNEEDGIALYSPEIANFDYNSLNYYNEIVSLIHNKSLRIYYTPAIISNSAEVFEYFADIRPYGTSLNFTQVVESAISNNLLASIEQIVFQKIDMLFHYNEKVVLYISLPILQCIVENDFQVRVSHFSLCLNQDELYMLENETINLEDLLSAAKKKGYSLALSFTSVPEAALEDSILKHFDFFVFEGDLTKNLKMDSHIQANLRMMMNSYQTYNVPIIIKDLLTQADLEFALASGVEYLLSQAVSLPSSVFEKIDSLKSEKVMSLYEKLN